jgi:hypothetical protein
VSDGSRQLRERCELVDGSKANDRDLAIGLVWVATEAWRKRHDLAPRLIALLTLQPFRAHLYLPAVDLDPDQSGFLARLMNHAGCTAEPPDVPVTSQLVFDAPFGKRLRSTCRRSPDLAPIVVSRISGWPLIRKSVPRFR